CCANSSSKAMSTGCETSSPAPATSAARSCAASAAASESRRRDSGSARLLPPGWTALGDDPVDALEILEGGEGDGDLPLLDADRDLYARVEVIAEQLLELEQTGGAQLTG